MPRKKPADVFERRLNEEMHMETAGKRLKKVENRLRSEFYNKSATELAKGLLGKVLVRHVTIESKKIELRARIVETEAYLGGEDKASHSYKGMIPKGKETPRNKAMFMEPGTAYVYPIYGMYQCFNISSSGDGAAVLIRALEPLVGMEFMERFRREKTKNSAARNQGNRGEQRRTEETSLKIMKSKDLCNGPSKLCIAMNISKEEFNTKNLTSDSVDLYVIDNGYEVTGDDIVLKPRIGIGNYAQEWTGKPLRDHP